MYMENEQDQANTGTAPVQGTAQPVQYDEAEQETTTETEATADAE